MEEFYPITFYCCASNNLYLVLYSSLITKKILVSSANNVINISDTSLFKIAFGTSYSTGQTRSHFMVLSWRLAANVS